MSILFDVTITIPAFFFLLGLLWYIFVFLFSTFLNSILGFLYSFKKPVRLSLSGIFRSFKCNIVTYIVELKSANLLSSFYFSHLTLFLYSSLVPFFGGGINTGKYFKVFFSANSPTRCSCRVFHSGIAFRTLPFMSASHESFPHFKYRAWTLSQPDLI